MSYLLRVAVPDRPGALGALAVALGSVGADIVSMDVVERVEGVALDDIVVDVPGGTLPDTLITAAERLDGVAVETLQPFGGVIDAHRELELIDAVATAGRDRLQLLVDEIPSVLRVGWALVVSPDGGGTVVARGSSAPSTECPVPPAVTSVGRPTVVDPERVPDAWAAMDTALAAAPLDAGRVLVIGRPGGPELRPSEVGRLGYVAGILRSVDSG